LRIYRGSYSELTKGLSAAGESHFKITLLRMMTALITVSGVVPVSKTCRSSEIQATGKQSTPLATIVAPLLEECLSPAVGKTVILVLYT
jgi:hypothetical protein